MVIAISQTILALAVGPLSRAHGSALREGPWGFAQFGFLGAWKRTDRQRPIGLCAWRKPMGRFWAVRTGGGRCGPMIERERALWSDE